MANFVDRLDLVDFVAMISANASEEMSAVLSKISHALFALSLIMSSASSVKVA